MTQCATVNLADMDITSSAIRHAILKLLFGRKAAVTKFKVARSSLGLSNKITKTNMVVVKPGNTFSIVNDISGSESTSGLYANLDDTDDYIDVETSIRTVRFTKLANGKYSVSGVTRQFSDTEQLTVAGCTFYFGGVGTNGENEGGSSGDPYAFPLYGKPFKLEDKNAIYCLYKNSKCNISATVRKLNQSQESSMRQWALSNVGDDNNMGAPLITSGYFYRTLSITTPTGSLELDLENYKCNISKKHAFTFSYKTSTERNTLYHGEKKATTFINWKQDGHPMSIAVDFYANPQIRNGIRLNTIGVCEKASGILVENTGFNKKIKSATEKWSKH